MPLQGSAHIFHSHLLHPANEAAILRPHSDLIWPSVFILLSLGLLVLLKIQSYPKLVKVIQSVYNQQTLQQFEREEPNSFKFFSVALNLFFVLNLSFLIYKTNRVYGFVFVEQDSLLQFMLFSLIVLLVFGGKAAFNKVLAVFTGEERVISEYVTSSALISQAAGLFLFPWVLMVEFSTFNPLIFLTGAVIILTSATVIKWYRGFVICLLRQRVGILQTFSYFCGLEILPVLVLVKYLIETF